MNRMGMEVVESDDGAGEYDPAPRSILVADDELDAEEVQEWVNKTRLEPLPTLLFAKDKKALFNILDQRGGAGKPLPCIIFLDLVLKSRQVGLETLQTLKSDERFQGLPVVIYSSSSDPKDIIDTNALRANSYLAKGSGLTQGERFAEALLYWLRLDRFGGGYHEEGN